MINYISWNVISYYWIVPKMYSIVYVVMIMMFAISSSDQLFRKENKCVYSVNSIFQLYQSIEIGW